MVYWSEAAGPVGVLRRLPEAGRAVSPGCGASRISPDSRETGHVVRFSIARPWRIAKLSKHEAANARSGDARRATRNGVSLFRMAERRSGRWLDSQGYGGP